MWLQLILSVVVLLLTRRVWRRWRYDLHKIPSPPGLPFLGHTMDFACGEAGRNVASWLKHCYKKLGYPKLMMADVFGQTWLFVADAECAKSVVMSKTDQFPKRQEVMSYFITMAGNDPKTKRYFSIGEQTPYVKAMRKTIATAVQSSRLKTAFPKIKEVVHKVVDIIESEMKNGPIDMQKICLKMALDVTGVWVFQTNLGGLDGSRSIHKSLDDTLHIAQHRTVNPFYGLMCMLFPFLKRVREENAVIEALSKEYHKLALELYERPEPQSEDVPLWYALRTLVDPETQKVIPFETFRAEIASLLLGGTDRTGHQMGWLLGLLSTHPAVTNKILEELKEHGLYGSNSRDVTFEDLNGLTYLGATIKEGMRIAYVFSGSIPRSVPRDMELLGYRVPKGAFLMVAGTRSTDSEAEWGDPDAFRPERWLEEDMSKRHYLAFSSGPRDCLGRGVALMEMRLVIINLLTRYELELQGSFEQLMASSRDTMSIEAKDGVWIQFKPRA